MKTSFNALGIAALLFLLISPALATTTSTTLSAAVDTKQEYVTVAANTGMVATGRNNAINTVLYVNKEAMTVVSISGLVVQVKRGQFGTPIMSHYSADTVWVAPPGHFKNADPYGPCVSTAEPTLPAVSIPTGNVFDCTGSPERWALIGWGSSAGATVTGTGAYALGTAPTLTSPAVTTDIRATTAGSPTVGTAAKPFAGGYFGTAATNNFHLIFGATAAARSVTYDDPLGNDKVAYLAAAQTLTNKTITGNINGDTVKATTEFVAVTGTTGTTLTNVVGMVTTVVPGTYR
ncbi:MAG: hypothetical protein ABFD86_23775, partial [Bryobacteraceae bacterium]